MSRIEKLLIRFLSVPSDLTWDELTKVLNHKGYNEISKKGKTGGSWVKFVNDKGKISNLY